MADVLDPKAAMDSGRARYLANRLVEVLGSLHDDANPRLMRAIRCAERLEERIEALDRHLMASLEQETTDLFTGPSAQHADSIAHESAHADTPSP